MSILKPHSEDTFCLAPIIALVQGSENIKSMMCKDVKKALFSPLPYKKQKKVTQYYTSDIYLSPSPPPSTEMDEEQGTGSKHKCNNNCMLNQFTDPVCFIRFVQIFKVIIVEIPLSTLN